MAKNTNRNHHPGDGSTGPKTPAGLEASSRNALRHGGCSQKHFILADEKQEDFDALVNYWLDHYRCDRDSERIRIQQIAEREWILRRLERQLDQAQFDLFCQVPNAMDWTDEQHRKLALLQRYKTAAERSFQTAWKNMEALRKNRMEELKLLEQVKNAYYLNRKRGFVANEGPLFEKPQPADQEDETCPDPTQNQPERPRT